MQNKIKKFLSLFKKKFIFTTPEQKKIIAFDCQGNNYLHDLFIEHDYFLLSTRFNEIKLILIIYLYVVEVVELILVYMLDLSYMIIILKLLELVIIYQNMEEVYMYVELQL